MTLEAELEDALCGFYNDIDSSRRVVERAAIDSKWIAFREAAAENWFNIVAEARNQDRLLDLVIAARRDVTDRRLEDIERRIREPKRPTNGGSQGPVARCKRALLVGVAGYTEGLPALSAATSNVEALEKLLGKPSFGFEVTALRDPSKQDLLDALGALFLSAKRDELLLLYYAGHVVLNDKGLVHLTTRDTIVQPQTLTARAVAFSTLEQDFLADSGAQILLVFDACWSQVGAAGRGEVGHEAVNDALDAYLGRGCDKVLIASSTDAGPAQWQDDRSPLTAGLVRALLRDEADTNGDGVLSADELIHALDQQPSGFGETLRPFHKALHVSPSRIELRGRRRATVELKPDEQRFVDGLRPDIAQGHVMPFFGDGVYGNGPLSFSSLAAELAMQAGLGLEKRDDLGLATAAESLELKRDDRASFLESLGRIIADQSDRCDPPAAYELLLDMEPPWLAVTVNYDRLLERRLAAAHHPYVIVSHVLRVLPDPEAPEAGGTPPGLDEPARSHPSAMMLVVRSKDHPEVKRDPAREVELRPPSDLGTDPGRDRIVYKLLGAPFLNELAFARARRLDTVAITETDHIDFLTKLRGKGTGVPSALVSRWFRTKKLLFLEYHLDVWHYRLIGQVFRNKPGSADGSVAIKEPYVVRVEPSPMEQSFWKRFNPDRISLDLKTLVRALRAGRRE
jgi:hypothetical protein